jgi:hypothetical protein
MDLDAFLGHKTSTRSGGSTKTINWKKRKPSEINVWLHTKAPYVALWRHGWQRVVEREVDGEKTRDVWGSPWNCWEGEEVLAAKGRDADGRRKVQPKICPMCRAIEYVRNSIIDGKLDWLEPVFAFEGDDPSKRVVLTAVGFANAWPKELTRQQKIDLQKAGIRLNESWKQNCAAKCNYVFTIVDNDEPEAGVQIAVETTALGDALKRVINDRVKDLGTTDGDPKKKPFCIGWEYDANAVKFDDKYRARIVSRHKLTDEIDELITGDAPDLSQIIERGNLAALRTSMEAHALIDLPWDEIFGPAERAAGGNAPRARSEEPAMRAKESAPETAKEPPARRTRAAAKEEPKQPVYPPGTETLPCDKCGAIMADYEDTCWKCGAKYELDDEPEETPPPKAASKPKAEAKPAQKWAGESDEDDQLGW